MAPRPDQQGDRNKTIAFDLDISLRMVDYHRATAMKAMGAVHLPDPVRIVDEAHDRAPPPPTAGTEDSDQA